MSIIRVIISNFDGIVIENSSTTGNYVSQLYISSDGLKFRKRQDKKVYDPWITIVQCGLKEDIMAYGIDTLYDSQTGDKIIMSASKPAVPDGQTVVLKDGEFRVGG